MIFLSGAVLFTINLGWALPNVYAGNTVCTSSHTDWYTSVIGETPCTTYERLRQICNIDYQVGTLTRNAPPDHCDDQVRDCCCNSISFALSMLCLACQDNTADGFDAGVGAYQQYLLTDGNTCDPRKDRNFTTTVQSAVCNSGLKIEDQLYDIFWNDGAWFYIFTRNSITRDHAAFNNKTQTRCLTTTSSSALPSSTSILSSGASSAPATATPSSFVSGSRNDDGSQLGPGPIAGIVIGVVVIVVLLIVILFLVLRRRRVDVAGIRQGVDPYTANGPGIVSSAYGVSGAISAGYLSDGDETTTSPFFAAPAQKYDRERWRQGYPQPSIFNTKTVASGSGSGHTPQGSSIVVVPDHDSSTSRHTGPTERHMDAGPVPGANLSRSDSGRLPPAYGEQLSLVEPANRVAEARPQLHMLYTRPEERYAQFESDYAHLPSSELSVQNEAEGTSMREVWHNPQPNMNPLMPLRRKE